jgi:hypothetical protein
VLAPHCQGTATRGRVSVLHQTRPTPKSTCKPRRIHLCFDDVVRSPVATHLVDNNTQRPFAPSPSPQQRAHTTTRPHIHTPTASSSQISPPILHRLIKSIPFSRGDSLYRKRNIIRAVTKPLCTADQDLNTIGGVLGQFIRSLERLSIGCGTGWFRFLYWEGSLRPGEDVWWRIERFGLGTDERKYEAFKRGYFELGKGMMSDDRMRRGRDCLSCARREYRRAHHLCGMEGHKLRRI